MDTRELLDLLAGWELDVRAAERVSGGLNASVWVVRAGGRRYVAKLADTEDSAGFRSGLLVARWAADRGFPSGAPVPRPDGALSLTTPAGVLALLEYVEGRPADVASAADQRRMGEALARAHAALAGGMGCLDRSVVWSWPWADAALARIPMAAEVRDAGRRVLDQARQVAEEKALPVQVVHGDPARDAFILNDDLPDRDGVVDWSATMGAPVLYDLGTVSATDPSGLRSFLDGYLAVAPEPIDHLSCLDTFTRLRWMCVALYAADRIARGILRGGPENMNRQLLARAYGGMTQ
jgi:Ser/Thr protein kinase RdoA (MazF antagonist)